MKETDDNFMRLIMATMGPERRAIGDREVLQAWEKVAMKLSERSTMHEDAADREKDSGQQADRKDQQAE